MVAPLLQIDSNLHLVTDAAAAAAHRYSTAHSDSPASRSQSLSQHQSQFQPPSQSQPQPHPAAHIVSVQLPSIRTDSGGVAFDMNNFLIHPRKASKAQSSGGGRA